MRSTKEAEEASIVRALTTSLAIRGMLMELGIDDATKPMKIFVDAQAALNSIISDKLSTASKHTATRHYWLRDHLNIGTFSLYYIPTDLQFADIGTKPIVNKSKFEQFRNVILGFDPKFYLSTFMGTIANGIWKLPLLKGNKPNRKGKLKV